MDLIELGEQRGPACVGQDMHSGHVVGIVHQRRDLDQYDRDQCDAEQNEGSDKNLEQRRSGVCKGRDGLPLKTRRIALVTKNAR